MPKGGDAGDNPAGLLQAQLAEQLFEQTDPLRQNLIGRSQNFLAGDLDVTQSPIYGALKSGVEDQYSVARDSVIGNTPTGGGLTAALAWLEGNRADALARGTGQIAESELGRALTLGTGTTGQSLGALGNSGALQAMNLQGAQNREAAIFSALGSGAGAYLGGK